MNERLSSQRPLFTQIGYHACHQMCRLTALVAYRIRCFGQANFPNSGGGLVCSNHQSHLDPVLVGSCSPRRMNFLAKKSLFDIKPLGALIGFLDAIPVDREGSGIAGVKESIRRIRRGELLLIFPEGARCLDGKLGPFLPGTTSVAKRSQVPLIPVGLDGAYQAWPRVNRFPKPGLIVICVGPPIGYSEYASLPDDQVTQLLRTRIEACFGEARRRRAQLLELGVDRLGDAAAANG
jgi:1-acyl-sn-glycerol-3-phosphate acyltransferase